MFVAFTLCLLSFISFSLQMKDPLKDFCRIFEHQTALVDRKLYIDGGLVNWAPLSANSLNYSSTWIKNADLDVNNEGFPQQFVLAKNQSTPTVHGGILWSDDANKILYQYGGEYGNGKPEDSRLWYYDIVYNSWNVSNASMTDIRRSSWGAGAVAQDKAKGYYYGGWLTDASVPGYSGRTALQNMLVYDMLTNTFRNQSGPDHVPRAEGVMVYLPVGDSGLVVYFGGIELPYNNATSRGVAMSRIFIYNIADDLWYEEEANGDIPEDRRRFCAGAVWAEDRSSYNIYLYGGASIHEGVGYGDVYVLSLPSFIWIKFWPRPEDSVGATFPHHSLTCDVVQNSQMIIMGGYFPNLTSECDVPIVYGQHGLDLGKANKDGPKWAMFNSNLTTYQVPTEIAKTIGGGPTGAATAIAPAGGWKQRDLQVQFGRPYTPSVRTPTRFIPTATASSDSKESDKKPVIGGVVGGVIGALLLGVAIGFCIFFHKRKNRRDHHETTPSPPSESVAKPPALTHQASCHSATATQYTRHNSPKAPSDHAGSPYGLPPPTYPDHHKQTDYAETHELYSPGVYKLRDHSFEAHELCSLPATPNPASYSPLSPTDARHEMPGVRFPNPPTLLKPNSASSQHSDINPYWSQHPPKEGTGGLAELASP